MEFMSLVYRGYPPNLLCCGPILRPMPDGSWLCVFTSGGASEPLPQNVALACRSIDGGNTWSEGEVLLALPGRAVVPSDMLVLDGRATLYLGAHAGNFDDWQSYQVSSEDSGHAWGAWLPMPHLPQRTFVWAPYWKRDGELVLPWEYLRSEPHCSDPLNGVLLSRDRGCTWSCHGAIETPRKMAWTENNVVELSDGTLAMLLRVDGEGALYRSDSADGGQSWGPAYRTDIPNPGSKFRLFRLSDGRILLVNNPNPTARGMACRWPLSLWISDDDLRSWAYRRDLVTFPGWLSYPDGFVDEAEECLHLAFDYNRHDVVYLCVDLPH